MKFNRNDIVVLRNDYSDRYGVVKITGYGLWCTQVDKGNNSLLTPEFVRLTPKDVIPEIITLNYEF